MTVPPVSEVPPPEPPASGWRTFVVLWLSQALSVMGSALAGFAFSIYLTQTLYPAPDQRTELAIALSMTALAGTLAAILGAPIAGAWADRHDRRRTMLVCDVLSAVTALTVALLTLYTTPPLAVLIVLVAIGGLVSTFHGSAFDTSYATLVPRDRLPRANGMMQTIWSLSGLASPALAAAIIALPVLARREGWPFLAGWKDGVPLAFLVDAVSFTIAALVLTRLHVPSPRQAPGPRRSLLADVGIGWRYILDRRALLWLLLTFALINFVTSPIGIFETLMVKFNLRDDWAARGYSFETALALVATLNSVGGVLGGVFISTWGGLRRLRVLGVLVPMIVTGIAQLAFGLSTALFVAGAALALMGFMVPVMNAHSQSIWQSQVPPELQGRVFSVRRLIAQFTSPVSIALAGSAAGFLEPSRVVVGLSVVLIVFCTLQVFNPALRRVEDREWLESEAARRQAARNGVAT